MHRFCCCLSVIISIVTLACASGLTPQEPSGGGGGASGGGTGGTGGTGGACEGPLGPAITNLGSLPACCQTEQGSAHCLQDVPAEIESFLSPCGASTGYCVPDQFLTTGGAVPPATCTAFDGPGVCLSICVPQVYENRALLQADVCAGDQLCVPCTNPLDMTPTGACDISMFTQCTTGGSGTGGTGTGGGGTTPCDDPNTCVYEATCPPVVNPATLTACAVGAHCLDRTLIMAAAPEVVSQLQACTDTTKLCVPDEFLTTGGAFVPPTCTSVNGAEGRCMSLALPAIEEQQAMLPQSTCASSHRCAPCYDPITGAETGACGLACDMGPSEPPRTFAACCDDRARCVPRELVDDQQAENLEEQECEDLAEDAYYCVPNELLLGETPPSCTANSWLIGSYSGVCLSDCLDFGIQGIALAGGSCDDGFKCAPCVDPTSGQPTGAPGCPP
jgi:hypothetical protein